MKNRSASPDNRDPVPENSVERFRATYQIRQGGTTVMPDPANDGADKPEVKDGDAQKP
jgi:hypothetical protein